ncbi:MAG: molybdopterin-dependent oxidoreductase [Bryobacteraceae bacterium]
MAEVRSSVCALDCPDTCSLLVQVNEKGRGTKLRGNPAHPITRGFLCAKVARYLEREYHPDRLLYPQRRIGAKGEGRFERISWDDAIGEIASKLSTISREDGPEAILPYSYAGTMGLLNGAGMDRRFFHRLGASRLDRTICASAGGTALKLSQGIRLGTEPEQFAHARLIIAWGANILDTNVHLWPYIVEARRKGAKFIVIDPVKTRTARLADRHLFINPGSDLALALGLIHIILREGWEDADYVTRYSHGFDKLQTLARGYDPIRVEKLTGINRSELEFLAREYARTTPAVIRVNYGVQRSDRGGSAIRAISALPVITGSWRFAGGGLQLTTSGAFELNSEALERPDLQLKSPLGRVARIVNMSQLGDALTILDRPPLKALFVYNSNPAAIAPNQSAVLAGLRRDDLFTVVLEQFQTDTADYADLVLPATTFLEHTDLYLAYGHYYLQLARPALEAPGETRSNVAIFRSLAQALGFGESCFNDSEDEMMQALLNSGSPYLQNITLERLDAEKWVKLNLSCSCQPFLPFAEGNFRTSSGKFEFGAEALDYTAPIESRGGDAELRARFPFELISSKNGNSLNSTFGHREDVTTETSKLSVNPLDASALGISEGDPVRVENDRGGCYFFAALSDDVAPGVVAARTMRWNKFSKGGAGVNQLTSPRLTDIGGGPTFYSCLVRVVADRGSGPV